jgi:hypothetical protein
MKQTIATLLMLTAFCAQSQTIATATTTAGSTIRLMAQQGDCSKGWHVFVNVDKSTSRADSGCWRLDGDQVIAIYSGSGGTYFYDLGHFTMTPEPKRQARRGDAL